MSQNPAIVEFAADPLAGMVIGASLQIPARPEVAAHDEAGLALWMVGAAMLLFKLSLVIALCAISAQSGRWRGDDLAESPPGKGAAGALERPTDERPDAA